MTTEYTDDEKRIAASIWMRRAQAAETELRLLRDELNAWRETFEEQTNTGASQRSYAQCYAIGTRKLLCPTEAKKEG